MNLNQIFCLSGCGYLKDLVRKGGKQVALIRAMTTYDMRTLSKDEVWINCEVSDVHQQAYLNQFMGSVHAGDEVIITFKAEYSAFVNASSCLAPEDPDYIVTLQSKLRVLEDCYINGRPVEMNNHKLKVVG